MSLQKRNSTLLTGGMNRLQAVSGPSPPEREKGRLAICERVAALYVVDSNVIYINSHSDSRLNSSISCGEGRRERRKKEEVYEED